MSKHITSICISLSLVCLLALPITFKHQQGVVRGIANENQIPQYLQADAGNANDQEEINLLDLNKDLVNKDLAAFKPVAVKAPASTVTDTPKKVVDKKVEDKKVEDKQEVAKDEKKVEAKADSKNDKKKDDNKKALADARDALDKAEKKYEDAKEKLDDAKYDYFDDPSKKNLKKVQTAEKELKDARRELEKANRKLERLEDKLDFDDDRFYSSYRASKYLRRELSCYYADEECYTRSGLSYYQAKRNGLNNNNFNEMLIYWSLMQNSAMNTLGQQNIYGQAMVLPMMGNDLNMQAQFAHLNNSFTPASGVTNNYYYGPQYNSYNMNLNAIPSIDRNFSQTFDQRLSDVPAQFPMNQMPGALSI